MLIKIGDVVNQFGISHKALYYWENAGIIKSMRGDNEYRYYDDDNLKKIKQIVLHIDSAVFLNRIFMIQIWVTAGLLIPI